MTSDILRLILPAKSAPARRTDSDSEILLPIIILLIADKGDFFLILSLMYILL